MCRIQNSKTAQWSQSFKFAEFPSFEYWRIFVGRCAIWNVKNSHGGVLLSLATLLLKVTLLHGCFSRFLDCTNGTKLRNASHIITVLLLPVLDLPYSGNIKKHQ